MLSITSRDTTVPASTKGFPLFQHLWFCDCLVQQAILDIEFLVDLVAITGAKSLNDVDQRDGLPANYVSFPLF